MCSHVKHEVYTLIDENDDECFENQNAFVDVCMHGCDIIYSFIACDLADCIGSAFNIKGAMQCPNCRKIEKGQWLYANGGRQLPEFSMDDWPHDEDLHDLSYSEMSVGVQWCPYSGLTRLPSSSEFACDLADCIGSAFNIKGAMQCPNCRKIEKGQWLYANGGRQLPEFSMDDWPHDEDLHDLSYSEMSVGVQWCPYSGLTRLPSSSDEGEFSSSACKISFLKVTVKAYLKVFNNTMIICIVDQDLVGHHAIFAEHAPMSSATHPCPYIAYVGTFHPPFSTSSGNTRDGSSFSNHWSGLSSAPSEVPNSYVFPSMDGHYHHNWEHPSHFAASNRIGSADQPPIPSLAQRTARSSDIPTPGMHPFIVGRSSITSSVLPPYPGPVAQQSIGAPVARTSLVSTG
ncbi:hypothetical protein SASPL_105908 [Salvia splendens]|uniref:Uncharacterized protein n=1 Tax=Salvia splendens TaxID=180675 RepID=A0A8X8YLX3_SALSN|nr:hypothetical protein SASPL_105908 [Salvia splendens]